MKLTVSALINSITDINNIYRDPSSSIQCKLEALWVMGDTLSRLGVNKPHSVGWAIQRETRGLIKRPTIFRSHKVRSIWSSKENLLHDLGGLQGLSSLTELLPLIDPAQKVKRQLSTKQLADLFAHACTDSPGAFKAYLQSVKRAYSNGKLGKSLDRSKHLQGFNLVVRNFNLLHSFLINLLRPENFQARLAFRAHTSVEELRAFSNMCISLTTKENYKLYKRIKSLDPSSSNMEFLGLYNEFRRLLVQPSDVERARLRRVISAEAMAGMSDMVSSLSTEETVQDFIERQKISFSL